METLKAGTTVTYDGQYKNAFIISINEDGTYNVRWFDVMFYNVEREELTVTK